LRALLNLNGVPFVHRGSSRLPGNYIGNSLSRPPNAVIDAENASGLDYSNARVSLSNKSIDNALYIRCNYPFPSNESQLVFYTLIFIAMRR